MLLLYTTFGTRKDAREIIKTLVSEELIACANLVEIDSIYCSNEELIEDEEVLALCKIAEKKKNDVRRRLEELHPYDVPCIVFYESVDALDEYDAWVSS